MTLPNSHQSGIKIQHRKIHIKAGAKNFSTAKVQPESVDDASVATGTMWAAPLGGIPAALSERCRRKA